MIRFEKLNEESFVFDGKRYRRGFPQEFFLSFEDERLTGYCRLDLLEQSIEECRGESPLIKDALRRCVLDFFLESGCEEVLERSTGRVLNAREALLGSCSPVLLQTGKKE